VFVRVGASNNSYVTLFDTMMETLFLSVIYCLYYKPR